MRRWISVLALSCLLAGTASADGVHAGAGEDDTTEVEPARYGWALLEAIGILAVPGAYYWSTQKSQSVDWELDWDWPSWRSKLVTFDALEFDTNDFTVNAVRHPLAGVLDYHAARTNGLGMAGSTVFAFLTGVLWEYTVEYKENPSINDMILNAAGGISIGEPFYQIGQLWRGGNPTLADRARTALFSPFDAGHDALRGTRGVWHRRTWHRFELGAGAASVRLPDASTRTESMLRADLEVVNHTGYGGSGATDRTITPGAWSRLVGEIRFQGGEIASTWFQSRTSIIGRYRRDLEGRGMYLGLGSAFTYHHALLAAEWDRLAVAHLLGPQLELSRDRVRWELGAYGDFALVQAHVFGLEAPMPPPPPLLSPLQAHGYYDAVGVSLTSRLTLDDRRWALALEGAAHQFWSLDVAQRGTEAEMEAVPRGVSDERITVRASLGLRLGPSWGVSAVVSDMFLRGAWQDQERSGHELTGGLMLQLTP